MFLSGEAIAALCNESSNSLISAPIIPENIQQASYDLRLGEEAYIVGRDLPIRLSAEKDRYVTIAPGEFALLTSLESVNLPKGLIGFITLRNRFKLEGLINISGFHVDPTFHGKLIFGVNNAGPTDLRLRLGEPTFSIFFARVEHPGNKVRSLGPKELPLEYIQLLGGSSLTLTKLQKDFEELKNRVALYAPLGLALLAALILNLLKGAK